MISNLHIKNIGIIDDLEVNLNKGLNTLTGETGTGKTLIVDSLQIISGGRFSKEMIRRGEEYSFVELCIYSENDENSIDGNIIVSREIYSNGRNMCKINGRMVTVAELKIFMSAYIEIHGQNDNQNILNTETHIKYLDNYIGKEIEKKLEEYNEKYEKVNEIKKELKLNYGDDKEKQRRLDLLKYQVKEIEEAKLKNKEDELLEENRKIIMNSEKITENLSEADILIGENAIDYISNAIRSLEKIERIDSKYECISSSLKNIYYELQELSREISNYKEDVCFDEEERNYIEERLDLIHSLKRKYGNDILEILNYSENTKEEINKIENMEEYVNKLKKEKNTIEIEMNKIAKEINIIRCKYAKELCDNINKVLVDLEMPNAKINIHVDFMEKDFFTNGKDKVGIYIKTNVGENEHELTKIASGGEMSRIMLAIKKVLADTDKTPILIFDEIDTGISGKAANAVGDKLKQISETHQVLCISHLANITAKADYNYFISKKVENERTNTNIKLLDEEEVIKEIARISCGEINEISIQYATKLRERKLA